MNKFVILGLAAVGVAAAAATVFKAIKSKNYLCENDDVDDFESCDGSCCGDYCDIPAEKADDTCITGEDNENFEYSEGENNTSELDTNTQNSDAPDESQS